MSVLGRTGEGGKLRFPKGDEKSCRLRAVPFIIVGMKWPFRPAAWLLLLALMSVPGLGQEKGKKPDPFAEFPDTKMITVEYSMGSLILPSSGRTTEPSNEQPDPTQKSAQEVLESYGIHFPKGAKADYNPAAGSLRVTQTINNVKDIDGIIDSILGGGWTLIHIELRFISASAADAERIADLARPDFRHDAAYQDALSLVEAGKAEVLSTTHVVARSGQRSLSESGEEILAISGFKWDERPGRLVPEFSKRRVGLTFEVDPVTGRDESTISLNVSVEHHYRPPVSEPMTVILSEGNEQSFSHHRFFADKVICHVTMTSGSTLLIGRFRDGQDKDAKPGEAIERLAFLTVNTQKPPRRRVIEAENAKEGATNE